MFSLSLFLLLAQITVGSLASPTTVRPRWSYYSSTPWWTSSSYPLPTPTPTHWWTSSPYPSSTPTRWWTSRPYSTSTRWWTSRPYSTSTRWWTSRPYSTSTRWWTSRPYSTSTRWWTWTTKEVTTAKPSGCEKPFVEISGRCVFVDPFLKGSWVKSRYMCHELSAELAIIDDAQFFHDLLKFIRSEGIDQESYWIGGNDDEVEGEWRWVDGKTVEFGSPFWALTWSDGVYSLHPGNNIDRNCLSLDSQKFLYFQDQVCSNEQAAICERTRHLQ